MLAIHLENPVKIYGSRRVLDGVNLDMAEDEFYALMGPNGSGKTTGIRHQVKILSIDKVSSTFTESLRQLKTTILYR